MAEPPDPSTASPLSVASESRARLIERLFRENHRALITFLKARLRSETEAQDVAQETYMRMLQLESLESVEFHRAYLFRMAANLGVDRTRRLAAREKASFRDRVAQWMRQKVPDHDAIDHARQRRLHHTLAQLPDRDREALIRHFVDEESVVAIAKSWNLTDRMVRYYLARALAQCRAQLDEEGSS